MGDTRIYPHDRSIFPSDWKVGLETVGDGFSLLLLKNPRLGGSTENSWRCSNDMKITIIFYSTNNDNVKLSFIIHDMLNLVL